MYIGMPITVMNVAAPMENTVMASMRGSILIPELAGLAPWID
jgi:hypothetical protein